MYIVALCSRHAFAASPPALSAPHVGTVRAHSIELGGHPRSRIGTASRRPNWYGNYSGCGCLACRCVHGCPTTAGVMQPLLLINPRYRDFPFPASNVLLIAPFARVLPGA
jgi:hypothetical protein